jgi:hypothetical protein
MVLDLPLAMKDSYDPVLKKSYHIDPIQFSIYGSPVPKISVPEINVPYGGQVGRVSSGSRPAYDPISIKFLVDNGYKNYWILWNWINLFNDSQKSTSNINHLIPSDPSYFINSTTNYTSNFSIFSVDEYNNKIVSFNYTNAFPTGLSEINFSNQDPTEINCTVTFVFNQLNVTLLNNVDEVNC